MIKLKTILQSEASKYVFVAANLACFLFAKKDWLLFIVLFISLFFLFRRSKILFTMSLVVIGTAQVVSMSTLRPLSTLPDVMEGTVAVVNEGSVDVQTKLGKVRLYTSTSLVPGDEIIFHPKRIDTDVMNMPHVFDIENYWKNQGVVALVYATQISVEGNHFVLERIAFEARIAVKEDFLPPVRGYVLMMVLADKSEMDDALLVRAQSLSISHLFAISGMHVSLLLMFLKTILDRIPLSKNARNVALAAFLIGYNILTSFTISILRASIQAVCLMFDKKMGLSLSKTDYLSISMIAFLLFRPSLMFDFGFEMSFGISFIILFSQEGLSRYRGFPKFLMLQLRIYLFVTLFQIAVMHVASLTSILANLVAIEYVSYFLLPVSFLCVMVPKLSFLANAVIQVFEQIIGGFEQINISITFSFVSGFVFFLFLLGLTILFIYHSNPRKRLSGFLWMELAILLAMVLSAKPLMTKVTFLDVNQGDATLIQSNGCTVLIDTGPVDEYDNLVAFLQGEGIRVIHYLILTHGHDDHVGEAEDILSNFHVETLWTNRSSSIYDVEHVTKMGDRLDCGNVHLSVIHTDVGDANENNNSIVLFGRIETDVYLFSADIEAIEEHVLINWLEAVDVLKVPHHGSDTSSSFEFVNIVKPDIAIISVGKNTYGHPAATVLRTYEELGSEIYLTKAEGSVSIWYLPFTKKRWIQTS